VVWLADRDGETARLPLGVCTDDPLGAALDEPLPLPLPVDAALAVELALGVPTWLPLDEGLGVAAWLVGVGVVKGVLATLAVAVCDGVAEPFVKSDASWLVV